MGETLPLFESAGFAGSEFGQPLPQTLKGQSRPGQSRQDQSLNGQTAIGLAQTSPERRGDRHMHVAWHLSNALKAGKAGRRSDGSKAKLTAMQKRQLGNAICEHLLASLREQVSAENTPN
jgi:hypothetical protein